MSHLQRAALPTHSTVRKAQDLVARTPCTGGRVRFFLHSDTGAAVDQSSDGRSVSSAVAGPAGQKCSRSTRCNAAASSGAQQPAGYGALTERLVGFSSIPFTFIVVPQVLQNYANIQAGQLSALAAMSWVSWVAGLAGNAMMCVYLASKKEATAVNVQLIGIASNLVVLSQLWYAKVMPTNSFAGVLAASVVIAVASLLQSRGKMSDRQWLPFEALVGSIGVAAAPQVLYSAFASGPVSLTPSFIAAAAAALWLKQQQSPKQLRAAISQLPGLCATAMFGLSPIPQLVRNFSDLTSLAGLSLGTMMLALVGNASCIPRALFTRDPAWTFGSTWGCLMMGWAQLLSLYLGVNPETGARFLAAPIFAGISVILFSYLGWVITTDAKEKGLRHPLASYPDVYFRKRS